MKGVQCYELFGGIALKNQVFSFFLLCLSLVVSLSAPHFRNHQLVFAAFKECIKDLSPIAYSHGEAKNEVKDVLFH